MCPLEALLATPITFLPQPVSALTRQDLEALPAGAIALAENLRFTEAEKANDADLAKHLASLGDFYLLDAFSICHRPHASIVGVAKHLPAFAGLALAQEVKTLRTLLGDSQETSAPLKGSLAIVGGAKISTKLPLLNALLRRFERVAVGGGLANTLAAARGFALGNSLLEEQARLAAQEFLQTAGTRLLLPEDLVVATKTATGWSHPTTVALEAGVPNDQAALDIGSTTIATFTKAIEQAQLIVWNGPLGLFEEPPFDKGTVDLVSALAKSSAQVIAGGGETLLTIQRAPSPPPRLHPPFNRRRSLSSVARRTAPTWLGCTPSRLSPEPRIRRSHRCRTHPLRRLGTQRQSHRLLAPPLRGGASMPCVDSLVCCRAS